MRLGVEQKAMKIKCQITPDDYVQSQFLHMRPRPVLKWLGILMILAILLACIYQIVSHPEGYRSWATIVLVMSAYLFAIFKWRVPARARKNFWQQKMLQEPYEAIITDEMFEAVSNFGTSRIPWTEFHKYKVGKDMILVYQSDRLYHMFMKRWFTDEEFTSFQGILRDQLGPQKA